VLRAAGETETTQENIQDWLKLDVEGTRFQLLTEEKTAAVIFYLLSSASQIVKFFIYLFSKCFVF
jgi:hypothetical protein